MKKGIVMDINDTFLTLLTPEGEFLRTKKQDHPYTIGEEIHFHPIASVPKSKSIYFVKNIFKVKSVWAVV
ncbi:MAG: anti-sigma factor domain-containing protein, partial [Bacillus sp. (in: Bacteria)]|nr:anti-sigma factor domain-containing protein [Bacillus sp. (in: firmicutes)]